MVAISLYRGNLHRVPDVPRRWLMPTPKISLKDFKILLNRRNNALSRLRSSSSSTTTTTTTSNPNSNPNSPQLPQSDPINNNKVNDQVTQLDGEDSPPKEADKDPDTVNVDTNLQVVAKPPDPEKSPAETTNKVDVLNEKQKRIREVEDKLEVLNAKKHEHVLMLKEILSAEEELKRRNSMAIRPSVTLQADVTNDSGSITRHAVHRMGSEANLGGDMEGGGEADDASNQNMHSRHMIRMSSTSPSPSPSSESPLRRPAYIQHNVVPLPSRATTLGATSSPSRFAPTGHQGHPGNLPTVSVSGTNYVASSPSPAASGGTSVFRDARQPSPWN